MFRLCNRFSEFFQDFPTAEVIWFKSNGVSDQNNKIKFEEGSVEASSTFEQNSKHGSQSNWFSIFSSASLRQFHVFEDFIINERV